MCQEIARKHLDRRLGRLKPVEELARPPRGWIRAIRDAVGMTAAQLAARMGISQPRVTEIEKGEAAGEVTVATLERAAAALDCAFVYAFVPRVSLEEMVRGQARKKAREIIRRTDHSMRLEAQGVDRETLAEEEDRLVRELLEGRLRGLWRQQ